MDILRKDLQMLLMLVRLILEWSAIRKDLHIDLEIIGLLIILDSLNQMLKAEI
jgi:hypothetical protein